MNSGRMNSGRRSDSSDRRNEAPLQIRHPTRHDARAMWKLVQSSPELDRNSMYLYVILAEFFPNTCAVAESGSQLLGMVTAFSPPGEPGVLFVWQMAVGEEHQGKGIASALLLFLVAAQPGPVRYVKATIAPNNQASRSVFARLGQRLAAPVSFAPYLTASELSTNGGGHPDEEMAVVGPIRGPA